MTTQLDRDAIVGDPLARITGLTLAEFAASHWDVAPLLQRAAQLPAGSFADLLSRADVDELLSRRGLRTPFARMTLGGEVIAPARYTRSGGAGAEISDQVADDKVLAEFSAGATLVLQGLHRLWPPVADFASALCAQLGHPVQVNAYLTPPRSAGLGAHYDVHDVFILQFAGRKHWRIHEPVLTSPLREQPWQERKAAVAARTAQTPLIDTVLESGDMMYLPRGYIHAATSLGEVSGHLTVGVHPLTRKLLADQVLSALADDVALRRSLPLGVELADEAALANDLAVTLTALRVALDRVDAAAVARGVGRHLAATTRPAALRPLEQLAAAETLAPQTRVRARPGLRFTLRTENDLALLELADKALRFAPGEADALRAALGGQAVAACTLPNLAEAEATALLARLLREGVVIPA